ncbi:phosphatase PAP2 family protein [Chitinibacter sp. ZOR0017]|uniref:phosphatase PAP2 family protein n=1 Tax=Chitinibacter sp. ZOR0017 TaxID=1339254 RepID=UPI000689890F|nr:phosphatase PAP2 family protein [Chitinibacter sp. ZOR0017]
MPKHPFPLIPASACALLFLALIAFYPQLAWLDAAVGQALYGGHAVTISAARGLQALGSGWGVAALGAAAALGLIRHWRDRPAAWGLLAALVACGASNQLAKLWLARPRPEWGPLLAQASGYSLPSGHAMAACTLAAVLASIASRHRPAKQALWWSLAATWVLASCLARLVLGVHYFTDLVAGVALASLVVLGFRQFYLQQERGISL